jgi:TatD DNase family protein
MTYRFFDIHAHVHGAEYDATRDELIAQCAQEGVGIITVGTDYEESERAVLCAQKYEHVFATAGIHPVDQVLDFDYERLKAIALNKKVVAIGECGLDYYWPAHDNWKTGEATEKARQKELFQKQIELAVELNLPLMIHGRPTKKSMDAYEDILNILKEYQKIQGVKVQGNVHFFAGNLAIAEQFWNLGFTTSFTGVVTFTHDYDEVIKTAPLSMLMAETDSPYATPVPHRGTPNTPLYVGLIYQKIAELKGVSLEEVQTQFEENRKRVFGV